MDLSNTQKYPKKTTIKVIRLRTLRAKKPIVKKVKAKPKILTKEDCRNKGIVYSPPVLTVPRQQRVNQLVTYKREYHGIKEIEIASCTTPTF